MIHKLICTLLASTLCAGLAAQGQSFFKPNAIGQTAAESVGLFPQKFDTYTLDAQGLHAALDVAPWESFSSPAASSCILEMPTAQGKTERFAVYRVSMLDDELEAAYPEIRTYAGVSVADPLLTVRFSVTPRGFRALVMHPDMSSAFVAPLGDVSENQYIAYRYADWPKNQREGHTFCGVPEDADFLTSIKRPKPEELKSLQENNAFQLKIFRFCVAATGEFTQDHGGTQALGLAAVTEYSNMVSAITERDAAVRLRLTNATQYVIFTNPATDPYDGTVAGSMEQNPAVLNQYTNINSHDLGHVLTKYVPGTGLLGIAGGNVCTAGKARGCSSGSLIATSDYGPDFVNTFAHEVGHQMSAGHTWNRCNGGGGRASSSAFEPGSGSTIMSYAGACGPDNIQFDGDLYYHAGTIQEIKFYIEVVATCGTYENFGNNAPVVTLPYSNGFSIPISTPFELNGSATDADGDPLVFNWEGMDLGPETPLGQPQGSTATFRTWPATSVTNRYFPRLSTILANGFSAAEQLPTYSRDMNFRLTARDNRPNGGGVGWADVSFKATASAGPFLVLSPNTANSTWNVGELTKVEWDVANTNNAPVNCKIVNIRLSTDGGQTYPIMLAENTENDGSHFVLVPNILTTQARVRVEAADNVFFDLSNTNFRIQNPTQPSLTLGLSADAGTICLPDNFTTTVNTAAVLGYSTPISLELLGSLPAGATASFSSANILPGQNSTLTLDLGSVAEEGVFNLVIRAVSGTDTMLRPISILLRRNDFTGFALQTPLNGSTDQALAQTLYWNKGLDAEFYDLQFSDSPAFNTILASVNATTADFYKINFLLEKGKAYYWRVRPINDCGVHAWSEPFFFSTFAEDCLNFTANDLPKNISSNGTPTIESKITVVQGGILSDLVLQVEGYHEYFSDLEATLISPEGTSLTLWKNRCTNFNGGFNIGLSDAAPNVFACPPPNNGAINRPQSPFAPIIGQSSTGVWTLRIKDNVSGAGGTFVNFKLQFCQSVDVFPPFLVNNNVMPLPSGTNRVITPDFLRVDDPNNTAGELVYTLVTVPEYGLLEQDGIGVLKPGDQFSQLDLDLGRIRFFDYGTSSDPDGFRFVVSDGEGGFLGTPKFIAQPLVGTREPDAPRLEFSLFPNPASSMVWLAFGQPNRSEARVSIFDMNGKMLRTEIVPAGQEQVQFDLGRMPKAVYSVRVETESGFGVRKLVVK